MKRPNRYSKPLGGDRPENYHAADLDGQYVKDLNTYIDYLEGIIKECVREKTKDDTKIK